MMSKLDTKAIAYPWTPSRSAPGTFRPGKREDLRNGDVRENTARSTEKKSTN